MCYNIATLFMFLVCEACVTLVLWPGIELAPPPLEDEVPTTGPRGKFPKSDF